MADIAAQIANLAPEKRDLLLKKLKASQLKTTSVLDTPQVTGPRPFDPARDQNFSLVSTKPGIFEGLVYQVIPRRAPRAGEVEVEVFASSLNFGDVMVAVGLYPKSGTMGSDCAGRVVAVGDGESKLKVGDEVMVMAVDICCFSRYITVAAAAVVHKPQSLTFVESATIPTVFLTVYFSLYTLANLSKGERILVHSGTGGVGLAAIQYAESVGAEVFATVGTPEKREYLQARGIKHIFNSRSLSFAEEIKEATAGEGVDVVLNGLAGEVIPKSLDLLRPLGRFVELGRRDFFQNTPLGLAPFYTGISFHSVSLGGLLSRRPDIFQALMQMIVHEFEVQRVKLLPTRTYPAADIASAFEFMAQGVHIGKIAVDFQQQQILV